MRPFLAALLILAVAPAHSLPLPPPLETAHLLGKGLPAGAPPVALTDQFYALGWSRANAFAYLERRSVGEQVRVRLRVLDTVEDRLLEEREWQDWGNDEALGLWWEARQAELTAVFDRWGLVVTDRQLGVFPLIIDNEYYTLALRTSRSPTEPEWLTRLELVVHSTGRGLKPVGDLAGYWRWAALLGFVPSPFENRVVVLLLVQPAGWAGPSEPLRFLPVGLSLKAGFAKP